jgi:hypothetical protein
MLILYMAECRAARSGPSSLINTMIRSAMSTQTPMHHQRIQVCVVPGIIRIRVVVETDGQSG